MNINQDYDQLIIDAFNKDVEQIRKLATRLPELLKEKQNLENLLNNAGSHLSSEPGSLEKLLASSLAISAMNAYISLVNLDELPLHEAINMLQAELNKGADIMANHAERLKNRSAKNG
jgi:hypothetical protein